MVLVCFAFLYTLKLFAKKKKKLVWNCPNNLIYYATDVTKKTEYNKKNSENENEISDTSGLVRKTIMYRY